MLASLQWRAIRMTTGISLLLFVCLISFMMFYYRLDPLVLLSSSWFGIPFILILLLISVTVGFASGYMYGNTVEDKD